MNQYKILMMVKPITEVQYKVLTELGAKVPFDPSALKYNIYIYISLQKSDLIKHIKESFSCKDYNMIVTEEEVTKHMDKVKKTFAFNINDTVLYRTKFKKLPFIVKSINESEATLRCKLRTLTFELKAPVSLLSFPGEDEGIINIHLPIIQATNSMLVVDFDSDLQVNDFSAKDYMLGIFRTLIIVKTLFPERRLVFSNPDQIADYFGTILGVTCVYGDINAYIDGRNCTFLSDSPHHLAYADSIIFPTDLSEIWTRERWESQYNLKADVAYSYTKNLCKSNYMLYNKVDTVEKRWYNYRSNINQINLDAIKAFLVDVGAYHYIHTIEKQLRILHG